MICEKGLILIADKRNSPDGSNTMLAPGQDLMTVEHDECALEIECSVNGPNVGPRSRRAHTLVLEVPILHEERQEAPSEDEARRPEE
jgi:hypothetical protein